jgi:DNA-directed RNA polymerase II subunit RPB1
MARKLTNEEIEYIIDFIKPQAGIPPKTAISIANKHKKKLISQLNEIVLYQEDIDELKKEIRKQFFSSLPVPGESVGMCMAQSYGEVNTQSTLNTFHRAGDTDKTVVTGVARFDELLSATKNPKSISCLIYLKYGNKSIKEVRKTISNTLTEIKIEKICTEIKECLNKSREYWYDVFEILYGIDLSKYKHCVRLVMKMNILYEYNLTLQDISKKIQVYEDFLCVFSPDSIGIIDVFIDTENIEFNDEQILYITKENKDEIYLQEVVIPNITKMQIAGISKITNIFFIRDKKKQGEWLIETEGSNIPEIMSLPYIDSERTISNSPWDMLNFFGIESAKKTFFNEYNILMPSINKSHAKLLSDKMTVNGTIYPINRFSMKKEESGPMGKASFEESTDNFINASIYGEEENTKGVSASIICGKRANMGTGLCSIHVDVNKLINN